MENNLKPCPFCDGFAEVTRYGTHSASMIITCVDCGCKLETNEERISASCHWNTRHETAKVPDHHHMPDGRPIFGEDSPHDIGEHLTKACADQPVEKSVIDKALENAAIILANFKPEGKRDKLDEWQACYALLFKQMNDLVTSLPKPVSVSLEDCFKKGHDYMRKFPENGAELRVFVGACFDAAGVEHVD